MQRKLISLIVPIFNAETYVEDCLLSISINKTEDVELIVIDGNSSDNTKYFLDKYSNFIDILVSENDKGLYFAMNKGIALASGKIIGIIGADDRLVEGALKKIRLASELSSNQSVIYGKLEYLDRIGTERILDVEISEIFKRMIPHPATFVPKHMYLKHGIFNTAFKVAADYDLIIRLYNSGANFLRLDEVLVKSYSAGFSSQFKVISAYESLKIRKTYNLQKLPIAYLLFISELIYINLIRMKLFRDLIILLKSRKNLNQA